MVPYRRVRGGGETDWGVGFGFDFFDAPQDGGPVPVNGCDDAAGMGTVEADAEVPLPFDASAWDGIRFYIRSFSGDAPIPPVYLSIEDDRTSVWGEFQPRRVAAMRAWLLG